MSKKQILTIPILMRDDSHQPVQIGNAQLNTSRNRLIFRVDLDTTEGKANEMLGQAIELGLISALQINPVASDFGIQAIEASQEPTDADFIFNADTAGA